MGQETQGLQLVVGFFLMLVTLYTLDALRLPQSWRWPVAVVGVLLLFAGWAVSSALGPASASAPWSFSVLLGLSIGAIGYAMIGPSRPVYRRPVRSATDAAWITAILAVGIAVTVWSPHYGLLLLGAWVAGMAASYLAYGITRLRDKRQGGGTAG